MNIDKVFTYHPPSTSQQTRYIALRAAARAHAEAILANSPFSREQSLALTNVQQANMWANAGIAINEAE